MVQAVAADPASAGRLLGLGEEGAWDHLSVGTPVVRCFLGDNQDRWYMWYNGRSGGPHPENFDSGCVGVATSSDGVEWKRGVGKVSVRGDRQPSHEGSEVGVVLMPNEEDWWTFDTLHVGLGDVQIISSGNVQSQGGIYWMFYAGGDYNETDNPDGSSSKQTGLVQRPGLCLSQDGLNFARIEGEHYTGSLFDFGKDGDWDALSVSAPQVVSLGGGDLRMYFQATSAPGVPTSVGVANSPDGFRWDKMAEPVLVPGPPGSYDEGGILRPFVLPLPPTKGGGFVMYYEAIDGNGIHSIGAAKSADGLKWERVNDKPVFEASEVEGAWDSGGVRAPCPVIMGGGKLRLYYAGQSAKSGASEGIGLAMSAEDDIFSFKRREPKAASPQNAENN